MLIKDNIIVTKLNHKTPNCFINVELPFILNNTKANLSFTYCPDKFKIEQSSVKTYLNELTKSKEFNLEDLSALITEDLYDMAVPKTIDVKISQVIDDMTTSISTNKQQPK